MIVNLNLQGRLVIVVGGGNEALKRILMLVKENCEILVISDQINTQIKNLVKKGQLKFKKHKIQNTIIFSKYKPHIIITTTNDETINKKIMDYTKNKKILSYSSDNPDLSDFANLAIINFENLIQIAIFTGGKSPAISKKLRIKSEKIFKKIITKEDIGQIKIQNIARDGAKNIIPTQIERKLYLKSVMEDKNIKQLIKTGQLKRAENRANIILRNFKCIKT